MKGPIHKSLFFIYSWILFPLFRWGILFTALWNQKVRQGLLQRQNRPWLKARSLDRLVLIHCASGEFEYAKPVVRELKYRGYSVAISYFSPSYVRQIEATPEVDLSFPSPWESPGVLKEFLDTLKPCALLIARTDVWPGLVKACSDRHLPTALFSATLTANAKRLRNPLSRAFSCWSHSYLKRIFCVSPNDVTQFERLNLGSLCVVKGDTRYDQVINRLEHPKPLRETLRPKKPTLVAGSTWPQDEEVLIEAMKILKNQERGFQVIFAPHEPTEAHLSELENELHRQGFSSVRYTGARSFDCDVLLIDCIGLLAEVYSWGDVAFVGGSFRKTVHSVMEPLAAGLKTIVGPLHTNNREALEFSQIPITNGTPVVCVHSASEMAITLAPLLIKNTQKTEIQTLIRNKAGASQSVCDWVDQQTL